MRRRFWWTAAVLGWLVMVAPHSAWGKGFLTNGLLPAVPVPANNPQDSLKVKLGTMLYFDGRLSKDNTISCASCHRPDHGFADLGQVSTGVGGAKGGRNSPTVLNAAYNGLQFWDGRAKDLEEQALGPMQNPVEMAMTLPVVIDRLKAIPGYVSQFQAIFGRDPDGDGIAKAIAAFERTVISGNSPYDRYLSGDDHAMSAAAVRGLGLFNGKGHCSPCHSGPTFSDSRFHNLGAGYAGGKFADEGRSVISHNSRDLGAFKTPVLRDVALTAPYLHDGSEPTLEAVIDLYDRGGVANPNLDPMMLPLHLTRREKTDLVEFLKALTGEPPAIVVPKLP